MERLKFGMNVFLSKYQSINRIDAKKRKMKITMTISQHLSEYERKMSIDSNYLNARRETETQQRKKKTNYIYI